MVLSVGNLQTISCYPMPFKIVACDQVILLALTSHAVSYCLNYNVLCYWVLCKVYVLLELCMYILDHFAGDHA